MLLHQLLAIEKGTRQRSTEGITELHRQTQTAALFIGQHRVYRPLVDGGIQYPDEISTVTVRYLDAIDQHNELWGEAIDLTSRKDHTNQRAVANVEVEGQGVILRDIPATHLLFLEKQLENLRTFVAKIVELPPGIEWRWNEQTGLHISNETKKLKTEKVEEALLLAPATEKHPAQAEKIVKDKATGEWTGINSHGGIPAARKRAILRRINILLAAVKVAREEANREEVLSPDSVSKPILEYVFGS